MDGEIWGEIPGFENYAVSNMGRVKKINRNRIMRQWTNNSNKYYMNVTIIENNKRKTFRVARLVAMAFIENPYNYPQVNHKDENKQNNHVSNLEWCTAKYNSNYGSRNYRAHKNRDNKRIALRMAQGRRKKVAMFNHDLELIRIFNSITEAAHETECCRQHITSCCKGKIKTCGGYIWRYAEKEHE